MAEIVSQDEIYSDIEIKFNVDFDVTNKKISISGVNINDTNKSDISLFFGTTPTSSFSYGLRQKDGYNSFVVTNSYSVVARFTFGNKTIYRFAKCNTGLDIFVNNLLDRFSKNKFEEYTHNLSCDVFDNIQVTSINEYSKKGIVSINLVFGGDTSAEFSKKYNGLVSAIIQPDTNTDIDSDTIATPKPKDGESEISNGISKNGEVKYIHDVADAVFYIDGNYIKRFVVQKFTVCKKISDNKDIVTSIVDIVDVHDIHHYFDSETDCDYLSTSNKYKYFKSKDYLIGYLANKTKYKQLHSYEHELGSVSKKSIVKYDVSDINSSNDFVYAFIGDGLNKFRVRGILYTKSKSLVDFTEKEDVSYILCEYKQVGDNWVWSEDEYVVSEDAIFETNDTDEIINNGLFDKIIYSGCDVCKT